MGFSQTNKIRMADDGSCLDGLDDLFTIKSYEEITVTIPRGDRRREEVSDNSSSNSYDQGEDENLSIQILQSPAACTDPDLTGQILWPVSRLLSYYVAAVSASAVSASSNSNLFRGKTILELGAGGTALPSITAFYCGAQTVIATDGNEGAVLDLLHANIQRHQSNRVSCSAVTCADADAITASTLTSRQLLWGRRQDVANLLVSHDGRLCPQMIDVVLAADVVQWPAVVEPLLPTVKALLWREKNDAYDDPTAATSRSAIETVDTTSNYGIDGAAIMELDHCQPVFILGLVQRASSVVDLFFRLADELGFVVQKIPPKEYLPRDDGNGNGTIVPLCCQEQGGRSTELYRLHLRPGCNRPLLLPDNIDSGQASCDEVNVDCLVGSSFEQTTFLPC